MQCIHENATTRETQITDTEVVLKQKFNLRKLTTRFKLIENHLVDRQTFCYTFFKATPI